MLCRNGQTRAESLAGSCLRQGWPLLETRGRSQTPCSRRLSAWHSSQTTGKFSFSKGNTGSASGCHRGGQGPETSPPGLERVVLSGLPVCAAYPLDSPRASALGVAYFSKPWSGRDAFIPVVLRRLERTEDTLQRHRNSMDSGFPSCAASG